MYLSSLKEKIDFIEKCTEELYDLLNRFLYKENNGQNQEHYAIETVIKEMSFHFFNQLWSNTGNGWDEAGTIVGHAFSYSKNFIAISKLYNIAFVFIDKYAYTCKANDKFFEQLNNENLPGASTERKQISNLIFIEI